MNEKNTKYLFKKYPKLFPTKERKNLQVSLMGFGFMCNDGWFDLINALSRHIQDHVDYKNKTNKEKGIKEVFQPTVQEVKEKFGGLRYYISPGDDVIFGLTWFSEELSFHICENCGNKGKQRVVMGWCYTLCDDCFKKKKEEKDKQFGKRAKNK